jgi:hypothetical protein
MLTTTARIDLRDAIDLMFTVADLTDRATTDIAELDRWPVARWPTAMQELAGRA